MVVAHILRKVFQSTPPVKAATFQHCIFNVNVIISIHAAREGGDGKSLQGSRPGVHFNPRRP